MKFSEIPYNRPDADKLMAEIDNITQKFKNATSAKEQLAILKEADASMGEFETQYSVAYVRNTINKNDEFYEKEVEFFDETLPNISEKIQNFNDALINSKFRPELEKTLGKIIFINAELENKGFSPEIIPLMQEENKLTSEYQKLYASARIDFDGKVLTVPQLTAYKNNPDREVRKAAFEAEGRFFDEHQEEFDSLFDKLVKCRTEQAKKLGYKNFVELGYIRRQRNCYGPSEVMNFRRQVLEDIVPLVSKIKKEQAERIGISDFKFYDDLFFFKDGNPTPKGTPEELLAEAKKMYTEMSKETGEFFDLMYENELFDLVAKDGKAPGGYCTSFDSYKYPFIFSNFNGTAGDVDVLTHEAGHAFAYHVSVNNIDYAALRQPSMEGCETHSMSMEFLTSPWHNLFFKEDTAKYELFHTEDALIFIPYGTMVDNFQELVYENPDWTPKERNEAWAELEKKFRPHIDFASLPFYSRGAGWQRQTHIYLNPFYYIDYCMAQTNALQIFAMFLNDREKAMKTYMDFVKLGGTDTFVAMTKAVGLNSPIEDGCLKQTAETIANWIDNHQI